MCHEMCAEIPHFNMENISIVIAAFISPSYRIELCLIIIFHDINVCEFEASENDIAKKRAQRKGKGFHFIPHFIFIKIIATFAFKCYATITTKERINFMKYDSINR
jgi:hypothetical protein